MVRSSSNFNKIPHQEFVLIPTIQTFFDTHQIQTHHFDFDIRNYILKRRSCKKSKECFKVTFPKEGVTLAMHATKRHNYVSKGVNDIQLEGYLLYNYLH